VASNNLKYYCRDRERSILLAWFPFQGLETMGGRARAALLDCLSACCNHTASREGQSTPQTLSTEDVSKVCRSAYQPQKGKSTPKGLEAMAIKVKDASASATKFVQRAQAAATDYSNGVANAGQLWQTNAAAAQDTWGAGVQAAISAGRYSKGVNNAGAQKYQQNASGKGAQRYPQGVAQAGPTWQAKVQPYLDTIASLTLPARRPKGDPTNYQRSQMVADALRKKKVGG
jgi:hypothetical protein